MKTNDDFTPLDRIETERLKIQAQLDAGKTQAERNQLGQFATPARLALSIVESTCRLLSPAQPIRFLDPAFGTGAFYAALLRSFSPSILEAAWGYEIDPYYGDHAAKLWRETKLKLHITDFTQIDPPNASNEKANLIICNPPYSRHHHLASDEKERLQTLAALRTGIRLSKLSGLYCYFLLISHAWLADGGLACWLIPSEFMDVNYGLSLKKYLTDHVTLLRVHLFDFQDVQFPSALVSSSVVWFRKEKPLANHEVEFSYDGTLTQPRKSQRIPLNILRLRAKWTKIPHAPTLTPRMPGSMDPRPALKLKDFFEIKRGIATGANKYFILTEEQIAKYELPTEFLIPILPSPRYLLSDEIKADERGNPVLDRRLFLLNCNLPPCVIREKYDTLWEYLQLGQKKGIHERYLCQHRSPWYAQEHRPPTPFLCTYMGRQTSINPKPFRFLLNHSKATAPNVYLLLYPHPLLEHVLQNNPDFVFAIWQGLNEMPSCALMNEGRVYGDGLHKLEPKELANAPAPEILALLPRLPRGQLDLWEKSAVHPTAD